MSVVLTSPLLTWMGVVCGLRMRHAVSFSRKQLSGVSAIVHGRLWEM